MTEAQRPVRVAVTMGDPGGVGPEVIVKALADGVLRRKCRAVIVGDLATIRAAAVQLGSELEFFPVEDLDVAFGSDAGVDRIPVFSPGIPRQAFTPGGISAVNGQASYEWIVAAAEAALTGHVDAICTAPIAKEALFEAGHTVPGHTELLASLCGVQEVRMMLVGGGLRVVLQTIHVALSRVPVLLTPEKIAQTLEIIVKFAHRSGFDRPRIAVCGLNPHASEGGHFGHEEETIISPALAAFGGRGAVVTGPYPADTVFHRALQGDFDFVLAMYHDQGLIPVKTLDFNGGVNVTLGLPIVRTSPDHGTAFDIAGRGIAHAGSMTAAMNLAAELARR